MSTHGLRLTASMAALASLASGCETPACERSHTEFVERYADVHCRIGQSFAHHEPEDIQCVADALANGQSVTISYQAIDGHPADPPGPVFGTNSGLRGELDEFPFIRARWGAKGAHVLGCRALQVILPGEPPDGPYGSVECVDPVQLCLDGEATNEPVDNGIG